MVNSVYRNKYEEVFTTQIFFINANVIQLLKNQLKKYQEDIINKEVALSKIPGIFQDF